MAKDMQTLDPTGSGKSAKDLLSMLEDVRTRVPARVQSTTSPLSSQYPASFVPGAQIRKGKELPNDSLVAVAKLFNDEITLDNSSRVMVGVVGRRTMPTVADRCLSPCVCCCLRVRQCGGVM